MIQLIVTGKMEEKAFADALKRAFPDISFLRPLHFDGFTSADVSKMPPYRSSGPHRQIDKLANTLLAAVDPGRRGTPADMAIVIDDLELENSHHPEVVAKCFRKAVGECVKNRWPNQQRRQSCFEKVRERCSFHLLVPMAEAYFFGESDALIRAGAIKCSAICGKNADVEAFLVSNDKDYLTVAKGEKYWAIDAEKRKRHPKRYLEYLCDPEGNKPRKNRYRETHGGARALEELDWNPVLHNREHVKFLRSLFEDISDRFALPNPYPGECASVTERIGGTILRNI